MFSSKLKLLFKNLRLKRGQANYYIKIFFENNSILFKKKFKCLITKFIYKFSI